MGFGHRVYKEGDPRAKYLREMSRKITSETGRSELYDISIAIEKRMKEEKGLIMSISLVLLFLIVWISHMIYLRQYLLSAVQLDGQLIF